MNIQSKIDNLVKKYKDKKIVLYGAGQFCDDIFQNYDLSGLNIIAIADKKFADSDNNSFYNLKCIAPNEIQNLDFDIVLISNQDYHYFYPIVSDILLQCGKKKKIFPLIKTTRQKWSFCGLLYLLFAPDEMIKCILTFLINIGTFYILDKSERRKRKTAIRNLLGTKIYGHQVLRKAKYVGENFWCGGFSTVTQNTVLKNNVSFNGMKIMGSGKVTIGRYFHSGIECLIITQNHNYDNGASIPYDKTYIYKDVEIGDFVWLGSRVMILPGTKIGEGAIIQGGSVVHGEIPPCAIAGGNPAKVFKYRDIEHFQKLKNEKSFY